MARRRQGAGSRQSGQFWIRLDLDPSPKLIGYKFRHLIEELGDLRPAWKRLVPYLRKAMGDTFMAQRPPGMKEWAEWSEQYSARRKPGQVLVDRGRVVTKLTTKGVRSMTKKRLKFGVRAPGVRALQWGSRKNNTPPRKFVVVTDELKDTATHVVNDHIGQIIDRAVTPTRRG